MPKLVVGLRNEVMEDRGDEARTDVDGRCFVFAFSSLAKDVWFVVETGSLIPRRFSISRRPGCG